MTFIKQILILLGICLVGFGASNDTIWIVYYVLGFVLCGVIHIMLAKSRSAPLQRRTVYNNQRTKVILPKVKKTKNFITYL